MSGFSNGQMKAQDKDFLLHELFPSFVRGEHLYISPKTSSDCLLPHVVADEFAVYDRDADLVDFLSDMVNKSKETREAFAFFSSGMDRRVFKDLSDRVSLSHAKHEPSLPPGLYGALICAARKDFDYYEPGNREAFVGTMAASLTDAGMQQAYDKLYDNLKGKLTYFGLRPVEEVGLHVNSWCEFTDAGSALMFVNATLNTFSASSRERFASETSLAVMRSGGALTAVVKVPPIPAHCAMFATAPPSVVETRRTLPSGDTALILRCA